MKSKYLLLVAGLVVTFMLGSCNNDETPAPQLTVAEENDLLFMMEEEKLARDTYQYLSGLWSAAQFANIKNSEQAHMNAIIQLLDKHDVSYTVLPAGQFSNQQLQDLYNQFVIDGQVNLINALKIGATIEDLDIVDLQDRMELTSKADILNVYGSLQCGSRNHLRSFISAVNTAGGTYEPQFLSVVEFNNIINGSHENCN